MEILENKFTKFFQFLQKKFFSFGKCFSLLDSFNFLKRPVLSVFQAWILLLVNKGNIEDAVDVEGCCKAKRYSFSSFSIYSLLFLLNSVKFT